MSAVAALPRPAETAPRRGPHLLPLPATEPPPDPDPWHPGRYARQLSSSRQPALDLRFAGDRPELGSHMRLVDRVATGDDAELAALLEAAAVEEFCQPSPTPTAALPEPRRWTAQLVQGAVEVMSGDRPVQQLIRWVDDAVYAELQTRNRAAGRRRGAKTRAVVRSVHVSQPRDGVVEAAAVVQLGGRCRALVVRIEGWDGRWRATTLQMV